MGSIAREPTLTVQQVLRTVIMCNDSRFGALGCHANDAKDALDLVLRIVEHNLW